MCCFTGIFLGYKIYRVSGSSGFGNEPYAVVPSYATIYFTDRNAPHSVTYYYRVSAFNNYHESGLSNLKSITPLRPAAAKTFTVEQEVLNVVKLTWSFPSNENFGTVNIYKRFVGSSTSYGSPVFSVSMPKDDTFDVHITPGKKIEYKMERVAAVGASIPSYDFIYTPYRDMNNYSKVYIRRITFTDVTAIDGYGGKPEFKIKVFGVTGNQTTEINELYIKLNSAFSNMWTVVPNSKGTVTEYWKPDKSNWYEAYSFYAIEYDGPTIGWEELTLFGQKFGKKLANENTSALASAFLEPLDVLGKLFAKWCQPKDDKVGYAYLNYYDDPFKVYVTNSAEKGGQLVIQFSDNSNPNVWSDNY